jgi:adhesin transport system membrane fusion protein
MLDISNNKIDDKLADYQLYSLKTLKTPELSKYLARVMVVVIAVAMIGMFLPWQQNVRGQGRVTAFNPANRPQTVQSAIPGRIEKWFLVEGDYVNKGDTILQLSEIKDKYFDPEILTRLSEQIEAKKNSLTAKEFKVDAYRQQIEALKDALSAKMMQANNKVNQSKLKVQSDSIGYEAVKIATENMTNIFERNKLRYESGNITLTKFQELQTKFQEQQAKIVSAENKYAQSIAGLVIARTDLAGIQAEYAEKISKANSDLQATFSEVEETRAEIAKMTNEYSNVKVRTDQYALVAPQSGFVVKMLKAGIGETIKEGEAIATIMPETPDLAVEMYVRAMDVPLLEQGRKVRIEFDGWPALQFSGWPNVAVGTFGGQVAVIDRVNNGNGNFRILVKPDPSDDPWPQQLRLGSGTKGWVMLENVPVWYEIWRQLNGFPPSLYEEPISSAVADDKKAEKSEKK